MARVGCAFHPILCSLRPKLIPSEVASTTKADTPFAPASPVLAITTKTSVSPAPEMNTLLPVKTYSVPVLTALVARAAALEPALGSVRQ